MRSLTIAILATLSLLAAACAPEPPPFAHPDNRAAAVGKSKAEVLAQFGEPTKVIDNPEGQEDQFIYVYDSVEISSSPGAATTTGSDSYCEVTFHLMSDKVTRVDSKGPNCAG
jgi:hypothetical protein